MNKIANDYKISNKWAARNENFNERKFEKFLNKQAAKEVEGGRNCRNFLNFNSQHRSRSRSLCFRSSIKCCAAASTSLHYRILWSSFSHRSSPLPSCSFHTNSLSGSCWFRVKNNLIVYWVGHFGHTINQSSGITHSSNGRLHWKHKGASGMGRGKRGGVVHGMLQLPGKSTNNLAAKNTAWDSSQQNVHHVAASIVCVLF